ncbi:hypothetical protein B296_00027034 [Ensete ventricosum]|uniref:Reverse transcriptase/retrotransposon-derived protein RNase H-like domain-containing protein n=1 Tax=Ensete ventricosum TaxID=4639 RepID=A0A426YKU4_ENSVE|nr:hypothetical protein B296_00027034 [Ensete ventricosum]
MLSTSAIVLSNFVKVFVIKVDASRAGISIVLIQNDRLLAYISKALSPSHPKLSIYNEEMLSKITEFVAWYDIGQWHKGETKISPRKISLPLKDNHTAAAQEQISSWYAINTSTNIPTTDVMRKLYEDLQTRSQSLWSLSFEDKADLKRV